MAISNEKVLEAVKKNKVVSVSIACVIVFGLAAMIRWSAVEDAQSELDAISTEAARYANNLRNASQLTADQALLAKRTSEIEARMLKVGALMENQQFFFDLEKNTGVKLVELRPGSEISPAARKGFYAALPYSLTVTGTYPQLLTIIRRLENGPQFVRVLSAKLYPAPLEASARGDAGSILVLTMDLEVLARP